MLAFAVLRPRGWPEAVAAAPAAALLVVLGAVPPAAAWDRVRELLPVVGFLAAILVLAQLCAAEGLFEAVGVAVARTAGGGGGPVRLLGGVFLAAALTTAVLSLDATVVLLTPVVFATAARLGFRARPHVYACAHLANSGSLPLPVSNLTNLLALAATGVSFTRFATLMAPPWVAAVAVEYAVFRWHFRGDLAVAAAPAGPPPTAAAAPVPRFALGVLVATLAGFVLASAGGVNPAWAALGGALVLGARALRRRSVAPLGVLRAANLPFCLFVLALGVLVDGVVRHGLDAVLRHLLPAGTSLPALLAVAAVAAVLANLVNNLPAVLVLLPLLAPHGTGAVLAALIGVNVGPNLSYVGSLATLLWRRVLHAHEDRAELAEFSRLGASSVPAAVLAATVVLWAMLRATGG